jgi:hypothetical protein
MSVIETVAPAPVRTTKSITSQEVAEYRVRQAPAVDNTIKRMLLKIRLGQRYREVVLPIDIPSRDQEASLVREDFSGPGCVNSLLLISLFREKCPEGIEMSYLFEPRSMWVTQDRQETITVMVVAFLLPNRQTRAPRKGRS